MRDASVGGDQALAGVVTAHRRGMALMVSWVAVDSFVPMPCAAADQLADGGRNSTTYLTNSV